MHAIRKILTVAAALTGFASTPSLSSSLNTDVSVAIPSVIALYCFDRVHVNVTEDGYLSALGRAAANNPATLRRTARGRNGRWNVRAPRNRWNKRRFQIKDQVNLDLTGVCSFRALSGSAGVRVRIRAQETELVTANGASIAVKRVRARDGANGGRWRGRYDIGANDLGLSVVRDIDIRLRLDLSDAVEAGTYSSTADGTFLITVLARP